MKRRALQNVARVTLFLDAVCWGMLHLYTIGTFKQF